MSKRLLFGMATLLILAGCSGPPPPAPKPETAPAAPVSPPAAPVVSDGVLTNVEGTVSVQDGDKWLPVDIGDKVSQSAVLKTGKASNCELQFGQLGVLYITENSIVSLKTIGLGEKKQAVDLELVSGSITAKVAKLVGDQRFNVRTTTVVAGVRGTRFMVTKQGEGKTSIAVAEGVVALVPPTYDPQALEDLTSDPARSAVIQAVMAKILESSPAVGVGKEVEVTTAAMSKSTEAVAEVVQALTVAAAAPAQTAPEPNAPIVLPEALTKVLNTYQNSTPAAEAPVIKAMTPVTQQAMQKTVELKIMETPPEKKEVSAAPEAQTPEPTPAPEAKKPALKAPVASSPAAGAKFDINKTTSIPFKWKAAAGATGYEVAVSMVKGTQKTTVKTWTTADLTVTLDKFDNLQPGDFVWEVTAVRETADGTEKSKVAKTTFQLLKNGQLSAPTLDFGDGSGN